MKVTYEIQCNAAEKLFIETVLNKAKVEPDKFYVKAMDERRILLKTTVRGGRIKSVPNTAFTGKTEERTWIIKYEIHNKTEDSIAIYYVLFDAAISSSNTICKSKSRDVYLLTPTFIDEGAFVMGKN